MRNRYIAVFALLIAASVAACGGRDTAAVSAGGEVTTTSINAPAIENMIVPLTDVSEVVSTPGLRVEVVIDLKGDACLRVSSGEGGASSCRAIERFGPPFFFGTTTYHPEQNWIVGVVSATVRSVQVDGGDEVPTVQLAEAPSLAAYAAPTIKFSGRKPVVVGFGAEHQEIAISPAE